MEKYLNSPAHKIWWKKAQVGFKFISGTYWENRANYEHFWPLCNELYKLAYGDKAELPDDLKLALAYMFASHAGRTRKGIRARPYFHHILMVVYLTWVLDLPLKVQIAAVHHDDVEDVPKHLGISRQQVENRILFSGRDVLNIVLDLTNDKTVADKHAAQVAKMAKIPLMSASLKLLDRTANMVDMRQDAPKGFNAGRIEQEIVKAWELADAMPISAPDDVLAMLAFATYQLQQEHGLVAA